SILLSVVGGAIGILLANWGIEAIIRGVPTALSKYIPGWGHMGINSHVLWFTVLISVLTGVLFGLVPALQATKTNLNETLKEGGGKGATDKSSRRLSMRNALVVTEIALSLVLLIGAGLFVRSFIQLLRTDLGVKADHVMTMNIALPHDKYSEPQQIRNFFGQLIERSAALPDVTNVGAVHALPLGEGSDGNSFQIVGQPAFEKGKEPHTDFRIVTPDYFAAIGTELKQGRVFSPQDNEQAPRVVIANEAFVNRFFKSGNFLGRRITLGKDTEKPLEIVGVVANVMNEDMNNMTEPCVYLPFAQNPVTRMSLVIRAPGTHTELVPAVRNELTALDPRLPLSEVKTMEQVVKERRSPVVMMMWTLMILGLIALAMAAVGTYAVMAYAVTQRTHEIGVRMALGAQAADILKLVLQRGLSLAFIGIALGLAGAYALTRAMAQLLYGVTATDWLTFTSVTLILALIAVLACWIPARRATKVDPLVALRYE
ncbi:MAG TPA: FtsX-like permease family protein, partial [Blastocatellia bacterium]|nr:FtsX-like permease family protein [Blastocatellia bacterium]